VDVATFNLFFALLALVALAGAAVLTVAMVVGGGPLARVRTDVGAAAGWLATLVAATCMAGSLYYSEHAHFTPCKLCWYQRICMYPLVLVLLIAAARRDRAVRVYAVPLAVVGAAIALYHFQLQLFPDQSTFCAVEAPCTTKEVEELGFITIPFMAFCGFAAIVALLASWSAAPRRPATDRPARPRAEEALAR
jgi:disulfide bond formation protein DsbB